MIVDCHTHVRSSNEADTSEHLAAVGTVDACIVLAGPDDSHETVNRRLSEYVARSKAKMVGFAVVDPTEDPIDEKSLRGQVEKLNLQGFVVYGSLCGFHPAHSRAMRFYAAAQEMGAPVFFHNSGHTLRASAVLEYTQPHLLDEVARTFPDLKMVIGNMGVPFVEQTLSMVSKHEHVFADLTIRPGKVWQTYNIVVAAYERDVMDKLLFGSGFPLGTAGECIETLLGFNMLLSDTKLPTVPRGCIRNVIERDSLELLGILQPTGE
ncbi:MAG: amidohydrolase family protein [Sedimentisphaerales bacterium]|nr:amidohydrolase family protein [Sedimentisphaerales bacterium]